MKLINIISAFITILFINQYLYAQETDPNSFFPYSIGNIWEYDMQQGLSRIEIIGDSLGNDGLIYLFYGSIFDPSWSIDTSSSVVYFLPTRSNNQYYKLAADSGDTWMVAYEDSSGGSQGIRALVKNKYPSIVFGSPTVLMEIEYYELNWGDTVINEYSWKIKTETLASGFGLILEWYEEPSLLNKVLRGCIIDGDTFGIITAIKEDIKLPEEFYLSQNYPNPFNPSTNIKYAIGSRQYVSLVVYDVLGNEVATLVHESQSAGNYSVEFNAEQLPSGIYIYMLTSGNFTAYKKLILMK
jgi:Secretion system C-terminal sorting domain